MKLLKPLVLFFMAAALAAAPRVEAQTALNNAELLEKSGIAHQAAMVPVTMQASVEQARKEGADIDEKFGRAWRDVTPIAFQPGKILKVVDGGLETLLTPADKQALLAYYNSPAGAKIAGLGRAASSPDAEAGIAAMARSPAAYASRAALYKELDEATGATPAAVNLAVNMSLAVQTGLLAAAQGASQADIDGIKAKLEQSRAELTQHMTEYVAAAFAYTYQSLSDDELRAYVQTVKSPEHVKFNRGAVELMSGAVTVQMKELGHLLYKALETGQPG